MKHGRIASAEAARVVATLTDDDVSAVQREEHLAAQAAEEVALVDRLLEEIDRELIAQQRAEHVRLSRAFTDPVRARRAHRRADRAVVRTLPAHLTAECRATSSEAA